jgi:aryl-phospho-beta-D-glucosidase BglC (GH1 family)
MNVPSRASAEDIRVLAAQWKATAARVLETEILSPKPPHAVDEAKLAQTLEVVDQGLKQGLYVIIGLGAAMDDNDAFFSSQAFRAAYRDLWLRVARRYRESPLQLAYDIMNEPHDGLAETEWNGYALELTRAIRSVDSRHTIVVEPPGWGWPNGFDTLVPTGDENTVYSFHFYGPMDFTHQRGYDANGNFTGHLEATEKQWRSRKYPGWITDGKSASGSNPRVHWNRRRLGEAVRKASEFGRKHGVQVWCGEFGTARWAIGAANWIRDYVYWMEKLGFGWAYFAFREWFAMDLEMDPKVRNAPTPRGENSLTRLMKRSLSAP